MFENGQSIFIGQITTVLPMMAPLSVEVEIVTRGVLGSRRVVDIQVTSTQPVYISEESSAASPTIGGRIVRFKPNSWGSPLTFLSDLALSST